jgi:hypothetical protein
MFLGFGTLTGRASAVGQEVDRTAFQLVSAQTLSYRPRQYRATGEVLGKQREGKIEQSAEKASETEC